jgi:single-strand DNA-binding protein
MQVKKAPTPTTIRGELINDPELRYTPGGHAVGSFAIMPANSITPQRCEIWRQPAEEMAADMSIRYGTAITVTGTIKAREWENREGEKLSMDILTVTSYTV